MTRQLTILFLALCLAFTAMAQTPVADRDAVLARIVAAQKPQAGKTQNYAFTQTKHSPMLTHDAVSHGTLTLVGERRMRWHYSDPTDLSLVVEGDTVYTETNGNGGEDICEFAMTSGRYVRMNGHTRGTGYGFSLWEMEVYGA